MGNPPLSWMQSRTSLPFFVVVLTAVLVLNAEMLVPYALALLIGSILAVLCFPAYTRLIRRRVRPTVSSGLVTVGLMLLVLGPLALFTAMAIKQAILVGQDIAQNQSLSFASIVRTIERWGPVRALVGDTATLDAQIRSTLQSGAQSVSGALLGVAQDVPAMLLQGVLALLTCFFMLMDGPRLVRWTMERLPLESDVQEALIATFESTSISVVLATMAAAGAQAALLFGGFLVLGVPGAFLAGGATFFFAWLPVVGVMPVWIGGAAYLYTQDEIGRMVAMIAIGLFSGVLDNLVRPLVLKGRGEMHPLVSLVAILGGMEWFGIAGVLVGPVLMSILISLLELWPTVAGRAAHASPGSLAPSALPAPAPDSGPSQGV